MITPRRPTLAGVALVLFSSYGLCEDINRQQASELMAECHAQRQQNIEPLKQEAIEDCINRQLKDAEYCERFNRNFGERSPTGTRPAMFWDLPICQQALAADSYFKKYPGRQLYSQ
jgi:hypothetical protein